MLALFKIVKSQDEYRLTNYINQIVLHLQQFLDLFDILELSFSFYLTNLS